MLDNHDNRKCRERAEVQNLHERPLPFASSRSGEEGIGIVGKTKTRLRRCYPSIFSHHSPLFASVQGDTRRVHAHTLRIRIYFVTVFFLSPIFLSISLIVPSVSFLCFPHTLLVVKQPPLLTVELKVERRGVHSVGDEGSYPLPPIPPLMHGVQPPSPPIFVVALFTRTLSHACFPLPLFRCADLSRCELAEYLFRPFFATAIRNRDGSRTTRRASSCPFYLFTPTSSTTGRDCIRGRCARPFQACTINSG
mmetsp:Transcript_21524/g.55903  ORF Transcript_21524/g.55903 Transcript_21524/m.55903 type:complete len:251 (-) Transcript_21524:638-1390(-)